MADFVFNFAIDTGNAAFADDYTLPYDMAIEALRKARAGNRGGIVRDFNGNHVGDWYVETKEDDDENE